MSRVTASTDFDRVKPEDLAKFLSIYGEQVSKLLNGGLDFETNFNAKSQSVTFSIANTDVAVTHQLGRLPEGYLVTSRNAAMIVYSGSATNTVSTLYLRSSALGTATILVF